MRFGLREIIFTVLLLSIPVGAWRFVLRPNSQHNQDMLRQIESKQAKLRELNYATGTIGDIKGEIASLEKAILYFRSKLPDEKEIDKVLKEIWLLAESNHLLAKSIRTLQRPGYVGYTAIDDPHAEQPIDVLLEGNFMGFYAFLQALENQPRIMRISKMTLTKAEKTAEGNMTATLSMSIFFERKSKDSDKDKGPALPSPKDTPWKTS